MSFGGGGGGAGGRRIPVFAPPSVGYESTLGTGQGFPLFSPQALKVKARGPPILAGPGPDGALNLEAKITPAPFV